MIYATGRCSAIDLLRIGVVVGVVVPAVGIAWLLVGLRVMLPLG